MIEFHLWLINSSARRKQWAEVTRRYAALGAFLEALKGNQ